MAKRMQIALGISTESLLIFLFHKTEFRTFFSSAEWFGTEFRKFSVPRNSRNSAGTNQLFHLFRLPRKNFFANPSYARAPTQYI
jgi:hypothetical protein